MSQFATLGDAAHIVSISSTLLYAVAVVAFSQQSTIFDPAWSKDGFCITNPDSLHWTSHHICLYLDTTLAALLAVLYFSLRKTPGMESSNAMIRNALVGIVGHGLGHYVIAQGMRNRPEADSSRRAYDELGVMPTTQLLQYQIGLFIFWVGLLKGAIHKWNLFPSIAGLSVVVQFFGLFVPLHFQFTYVQTILIIASSIDQLSREVGQKNSFAYAMYPAMCALPLTFVGWLESTQCSSTLVQSLHGHVMYDVYIPISLMVFYVSCYYNTNVKSSSSSLSKVKTY